LTFGNPPAVSGGVSDSRQLQPDTPGSVPGWPFVQATGQAVCHW